jgi:hypothetical protein
MREDNRPDSILITVTIGRGASRTTETQEAQA